MNGGQGADGGESQHASESVRARESEEQEHHRRDRGHVRVDEVRKRESAADQSGDDDAGPAGRDAMQRGECEKREVHTEDLGVNAEAAPDVAVVLEAVAVISREERSGGRADGRRDVGEAEAPHRPEHGQRKTDEEQVSNEIEERPQRDEAKRQLPESHDRQMREVLVVEELRKAELELGDPEIERVLTIRQRLGRLLDEENVFGVVVDVRDRDGDLGKERVERHRYGNERDKRESPDARER